MEQTFYMNILFGKNKRKIFEDLKKIITLSVDYRFQINPFRISPVTELVENANGTRNTTESISHEIRQHFNILHDINESNIDNLKPFFNTIFVNYTTKELEPALKYDRIKFYLCDYITDENIELLTLTNLTFVNFLKKTLNQPIPSLNSMFVSYAALTFYDTDAEKRIANVTSLDLGERTDDDVTFILSTRLNDTHITGDIVNANNIILPYHPFRHSLFMSMQNIKDNINAVLLSPNRHLIYYPFDQEEFLVILRNIMYERVFLNYLVNASLYKNERVIVFPSLFRNNVSANYRFFKQIQRKHPTHVLNELVFNYTHAFDNNSKIYNDWYNNETQIVNKSQSAFALDVVCLRAANGLFV